MRTLAVFGCLFVLLFGVSALSADVPGFTVYAFGGKAISRELRTGRETILVASGVEQIAVDPTGHHLIWIGTGRVWLKDLATGRTAVLPISLQSKAESLAVAPGDKLFFAIGYLTEAKEWILCSPGSKEYEELYNKDVPKEIRDQDILNGGDKDLPRYAQRTVKTTVLKAFTPSWTGRGFDDSSYGGFTAGASTKPYIFRNPKRNYRETVCGGLEYQKPPTEETARVNEELYATGALNVSSPVFSPTLVHTKVGPAVGMAMIKHSPKKGKYVELLVDHPSMNRHVESRHIKIDTENCRGIAWTSDGLSITYAVADKDGGNRRILGEDGKVLAEADATRFFWTGPDQLIFRDPQGVLWTQKIGGAKVKLMEKIPADFSYANPQAQTPATSVSSRSR